MGLADESGREGVGGAGLYLIARSYLSRLALGIRKRKRGSWALKREGERGRGGESERARERGNGGSEIQIRRRDRIKERERGVWKRKGSERRERGGRGKVDGG